MNVSRIVRAALAAVAFSFAISTVAGAAPLRVYDPTTHRHVTYDADHGKRTFDPKFQAPERPARIRWAPGRK